MSTAGTRLLTPVPCRAGLCGAPPRGALLAVPPGPPARRWCPVRKARLTAIAEDRYGESWFNGWTERSKQAMEEATMAEDSARAHRDAAMERTMQLKQAALEARQVADEASKKTDIKARMAASRTASSAEELVKEAEHILEEAEAELENARKWSASAKEAMEAASATASHLSEMRHGIDRLSDLSSSLTASIQKEDEEADRKVDYMVEDSFDEKDYLLNGSIVSEISKLRQELNSINRAADERERRAQELRQEISYLNQQSAEGKTKKSTSAWDSW